MLKTQIIDGKGTRRTAKITKNNALLVEDIDGRDFPECLPVGTANRFRFFGGYLGSTGLNSGTTNMNIDGSVTPQTFYVESVNEYDIYITDCILVVADGVVAHNKYGGVTSLTNGIDLEVTESGETTTVLGNIKTCGQIIAQMGCFWAFGSGTDLNIITNYDPANNDAMIVPFQPDEVLPYGLRLGRGTNDRMTFRVSDDLTGLVTHTFQVIGYRHYPREVGGDV